MSEDIVDDKPTKVSKPTIRMAGDIDNCGHCKESDSFFKENAPKAGANYEYYHVESDKGKAITDNLDAGPEGSVPIPAIEYCKTIDKDGEKEEKCDYVEGFTKGDWDKSLNYKKANSVDSEIDELFGDN